MTDRAFQRAMRWWFIHKALVIGRKVAASKATGPLAAAGRASAMRLAAACWRLANEQSGRSARQVIEPTGGAFRCTCGISVVIGPSADVEAEARRMGCRYQATSRAGLGWYCPECVAFSQRRDRRRERNQART